MLSFEISLFAGQYVQNKSFESGSPYGIATAINLTSWFTQVEQNHNTPTVRNLSTT